MTKSISYIYTPEERRGIASAFIAGKEAMLASELAPDCIFLCNILISVAHPYSELARVIIRERLDGCTTVWSWLKLNGVLADSEYTTLYLPHCLEYRLRWVDSLIEEFSK